MGSGIERRLLAPVHFNLYWYQNKGASPKNGYPLSDIYPDNPFRMMSYIEMFGKDAHKTLHVTYRSYQQKKLNQTRHVSFLIGGTREKICAKNGSYRIYIRIRVSVFGRRTLTDSLESSFAVKVYINLHILLLLRRIKINYNLRGSFRTFSSNLSNHILF